MAQDYDQQSLVPDEYLNLNSFWRQQYILLQVRIYSIQLIAPSTLSEKEDSQVGQHSPGFGPQSGLLREGFQWSWLQHIVNSVTNLWFLLQ